MDVLAHSRDDEDPRVLRLDGRCYSTDTCDGWTVEPVEVVRATAHRGAVDLLREARQMVPHADEPSHRRADWCARADAILDPPTTGGSSDGG